MPRRNEIPLSQTKLYVCCIAVFITQHDYWHMGRVYRVPEFLAGRLNRLPPPSPPQASVLPRDPSGGDTHSLVGKRVGGANPDEIPSLWSYASINNL